MTETDLFHQIVWHDGDFYIVADYTEIYTQYWVYVMDTDKIIGGTNANYYMGACRRIIKDYMRLKKGITKK